MRLWHDNSGQGTSASWFLKYIIVRDLQTMEKSYFICQQWFAVEKDDGRVSLFYFIEEILFCKGTVQVLRNQLFDHFDPLPPPK